MSIDALFRRSKDKFVSKILPIVKNRDTAEELVQDAFLKAHLKWEQYDPARAKEETWFKHILFNTVWDWKRSQKRQVEIEDCEMADLLDESLSYYLELAQHVDVVAIENTEHKKVFYLRYLFGYTVKEVASLLCLQEENVKKILQRAKKEV
jgi:RNA polymerase sigma factor (sigma-70 family)